MWLRRSHDCRYPIEIKKHLLKMAAVLQGFTGLPFELSKTIIDYLDTLDIANLRLTCSSLRSTTLYRFSAAFAHRKTDLSSSSLRTLVTICENENLRSVIRSLTIVAVYFDAEFLQRVIDRKKSYTRNSYRQYNEVSDNRFNNEMSDDGESDYEEAGSGDSYIEEPGLIIRGNHSTCTNEELAETTKQLDSLIIRKADQVQMAGSQSDILLLTTAMKNMKNLRAVFLVWGVYRCTETRIASSVSRSVFGQIWRRASHVDVVTISAIVHANLLIEELYFYGGQWGNNVPPGPAYGYFHRHYSLRLEKAFSHLRLLSLTYKTQIIESEQPHNGQGYLSSPHQSRPDERFVSLYSYNEDCKGPTPLSALSSVSGHVDIKRHNFMVPDLTDSGGTTTGCLRRLHKLLGYLTLSNARSKVRSYVSTPCCSA